MRNIRQRKLKGKFDIPEQPRCSKKGANGRIICYSYPRSLNGYGEKQS